MIPGVDTQVDQTKCPLITIVDSIGGGRSQGGERTVRVLDGFVGSASYGVHNPSIANLARGVVERVLCTLDGGELTPPVKPDPGIFCSLYDIRNDVLSNTCLSRVVPVEEFPSLYHDPRKRAVYERAVSSLSHEAINKRDATVSVFVKAEKVNFSAKPDPAPRVIQPRGPRYLVCVGRYLKLFEKVLFAGFAKTFGYNVVCKGLNSQATAAQLRENWDSYKDPVALGLDASRFDQHVSVDALKFEHSFYNRSFGSPELKRLLSWQLENNGIGYVEGYKLKYKVQGCRMSGDINTSLGNCIIMCCIVLAYFKECGVDAKLANNGDDCVVICERRDYHKLTGIGAWFRKFGFKLTYDPVVDEFEKIQFCQTQPVWTSSGWRMVRNPFTATSKDMVSLLPWDSELDFDRWRGAISACGISLTEGVPYWRAFYSKLGGVKHEGSWKRVSDHGFMFSAFGLKCSADITPEARYSFWRAFGMLPDEQIALEKTDKRINYADITPLTFGEVEPYNQLLVYNGEQ